MVQKYEQPSKKEIFSISLELYRREAFAGKIEEFLEDDKLNIVIVVTTNMIMDGGLLSEKDEAVPEGFMLIPGEKALFTDEEVNGINSQMIMDVSCLDGFFENGSRSVYLVGDNEKRIRLLMKCFREINPEIVVQGAYYVNPSLSQELKLSDELIVNEINGNAPDVLVVMMDSPRQEQWIRENYSILHAKICLGMGAVTDSYIKIHKTPPGIFKTLNLGWLYRKLFCNKNPGEKRKRRIFYKFLEKYKNNNK